MMWVKSPTGKVEEHDDANALDLVRNAGWEKVEGDEDVQGNEKEKEKPSKSVQKEHKAEDKKESFKKEEVKKTGMAPAKK